MEETKVDVTAAAEKPAKRTYNRQKKAEAAVKAEATKDIKDTKSKVAEEAAKVEVEVANEEKKAEAESETKKAEVEAVAKEEVTADKPAKPAEKKEEVKAVLSIEKPEIGSDEPDLKASYVLRKPVMIYFVPKISERCKVFVGVVRVLDKVDDKFVKIAYRDNGTGEDVTAYILASVLPQ